MKVYLFRSNILKTKVDGKFGNVNINKNKLMLILYFIKAFIN